MLGADEAKLAEDRGNGYKCVPARIQQRETDRS